MKTRHVTAVLALVIFLIGAIGVGNQVEASYTAMAIRSRLLQKLAHKFKDTLKAAQIRILDNSKKRLTYKETIPNIQHVVDKALTVGDKIFSKFAIVRGNKMSKLNRAGKIVMGHTLIEMMHLRNKSWSNIVKAMDQNHLLVRYPGSKRVKTHRHKLSWSIDVSGMSNSSKTPKFYRWYRKALMGFGILSDFRLRKSHIVLMKKRLARTIQTQVTDLLKSVTSETHFMEVVVMKILDTDTPHFQIYKLDFKMANDVVGHLHFKTKEKSLMMKIDSHKYFFRTDIARKLSRVAQRAALEGLKLLPKVK